MQSIPTKPDINDLVQKIRAGEAQAFQEIFESYWDMAYYYCLKYLSNTHDAEDAAQEVFLMLHRRICNTNGAFLIEKNVKWDVSTVCRKYSQKRKKDLESAQPVNSDKVFEFVAEEREEFLPHHLMEQKEQRKQILSLVDMLPKKQREAILLYYFNEFSQEEIAKITETTIGTVKKQLFKARQSLRKQAESLLKKGGISIMAATPLLTQLFREEMGRITTPDIRARIWSSVDSRLSPAGQHNVHSGKSTGAGVNSGVYFVIGAATATAVICGVLGFTGIWNTADKPVVEQVLPQTTDDVIAALKRVNTLADFNAFFSDYGFGQRKGKTDEQGNFYTVGSGEFLDAWKEPFQILAGYSLSNSGEAETFELAYEIRAAGSTMPDDVAEWVIKNIAN